jgi:hypothetical protein
VADIFAGHPRALIPAQMQLALINLPGLEHFPLPALQHWLAILAPPADMLTESEVSFGITLSGELHKVTWAITDTCPALMGRLGRAVDALGLPPGALHSFLQLALALDALRAGTWVQGSAGRFELGWLLEIDLPLSHVLPLMPGLQQAGPGLNGWSSRYADVVCTQAAGSLDAGESITNLQFLLPGAGVEEQLLAALELWEMLNVAGPPDTLLAALLDYTQARAEPYPLLGVLGFASNHIIKAGLLLPQPDTRLQVQLYRIAGLNTIDALAAFQGSLGAEPPLWVECAQAVEGSGLAFHYTRG